jgi:Domain of unknown function DUF29
MSDSDLYETDILAWSEQQAGALRELTTRRDLPNALDLAHVVEEIEDVGQSELNAVKSFIRHVLSHAIKCAVDPEALSVRHWQAEIGNWQNELADRVSPSMRRRIDLEVLWSRAVRQARLDLRARDLSPTAEIASLVRDALCPVTEDELLSLEPEELAARVELK